MLTGVSPDVGASMEWVRHPLHVGDPDQLNAIADSIFHRSKNNKQYVFFVHIRPNDDAYDEELEKKVYGDYEDANGRFKRYTIPHRSVPTLLHQLHKRFMFRASFQLRAPTQLLPHNALHSSFLPYSNANPFNEYYWHHKNSLLVIDDLDTVVGYHEFHKVGEGSSSSTGRAMAESVDHSHAVGRRFHVGIGGNANGSRTAMTGASDAETMVAASESGAAAGAGVGVSWDLLQTGNAFIAAEQVRYVDVAFISLANLHSLPYRVGHNLVRLRTRWRMRSQMALDLGRVSMVAAVLPLRNSLANKDGM